MTNKIVKMSEMFKNNITIKIDVDDLQTSVFLKIKQLYNKYITYQNMKMQGQ